VFLGTDEVAVCELDTGFLSTSVSEGQSLDAIAVNGSMLGLGVRSSGDPVVEVRGADNHTWQCPVPSEVGAIALNESQVWVGLQDGQIWLFKP